MKKLGIFLVLFACLAISGDQQRKLFEFDSITFRIDGLTVSMLPQFGKQYGVIEAIEVSWMYIRRDSTGREITVTDYSLIPVGGNLRRAYLEAKNLFEKKHIELEQLFEREYFKEESNKQKK